jgi:hypothetical protein
VTWRANLSAAGYGRYSSMKKGLSSAGSDQRLLTPLPESSRGRGGAWAPQEWLLPQPGQSGTLRLWGIPHSSTPCARPARLPKWVALAPSLGRRWSIRSGPGGALDLSVPDWRRGRGGQAAQQVSQAGVLMVKVPPPTLCLTSRNARPYVGRSRVARRR